MRYIIKNSTINGPTTIRASIHEDPWRRAKSFVSVGIIMTAFLQVELCITPHEWIVEHAFHVGRNPSILNQNWIVSMMNLFANYGISTISSWFSSTWCWWCNIHGSHGWRKLYMYIEQSKEEKKQSEVIIKNQ